MQHPEPEKILTLRLHPKSVTKRALLFSAVLAPFNAFWTIRMEEVLYGPFPSLIALFANCIFVLFFLVLLNRLLHRLLPRYAFSEGELLTLYALLVVSTALAGQSGLNIVCGMIAHGVWFATPENHWGETMTHFPPWMILHDKEIARGHYLGNSSLYRPEVLAAWLLPVLAWTTLFCLIVFVTLCMNTLVRRQWADHERLTFPVAWLPVEMSQGGTGAAFFQNKLMWSGFAVAFSVNLWNGLAFLFPNLRSLPIGIIDLQPFFASKPWSAMGWTPITLYPIAIGLSYLLPLDLLFSCWFFYLLWKAQAVLSNAMAWDTTPDFPFVREQGFGCVMGLFFFYLWTGRKTYAAILRRAWRGEGGDSQAEGMSERGALLGLIAGLVGLFAFGLAMRAVWWMVLAFFSLYLALLLVTTRIRAECGSPIHDFSFMGPDNMLTRALGTQAFSKSDLAFFALSYPLTYARTNDVMPGALEAMQTAKRRQMEARRLMSAILGMTLWGTLCAFWAYEHQAYTLGAAAKWNAGTHFAFESYDRLGAWVGGTLDPKPNGRGTLAMGFGASVTLVLLWFRLRFLGFPLHPIGYAVSSAWAINIVWLPMLLAWLCKALTLRYGGLRLYRQFLPFFLGLILGDAVMGCGWGALSLLFNIRMVNFFGA